MAKSFHLAPLFIDMEQFRIQIILTLMLELLHYWHRSEHKSHIIIFLKAKRKFKFLFVLNCVLIWSKFVFVLLLFICCDNSPYITVLTDNVGGVSFDKVVNSYQLDVSDSADVEITNKK